MRAMLQRLPLLICVISLIGCSSPFGKNGYLRDKSGDYTKAQVIKPMQVPPGMNAKPFGAVMEIPPITRKDVVITEDFEVPRPEQRLIRKDTGESFSIEARNNDVWILATNSSSELWSRLGGFFKKNALPLTAKNLKSGLLETDWVSFDKDDKRGGVYKTIGEVVSSYSSMEDKFQLRVRRNNDKRSTQIYIYNKGRPPVDSVKKPSPDSPEWNNLGERSQQMNRALAEDMLIFLVSDQGDSVSVLEKDVNVASKAELSQDGNGNPLLNIQGLSYSVSWMAIGNALTAAGVNVVDRNRSAGIYYLSTVAKADIPKKEAGFFSRLFGGGDKKATSGAEILRLRVSQFSDSVQVSVEKDLATSADKDESLKLLKRLKSNLK